MPTKYTTIGGSKKTLLSAYNRGLQERTTNMLQKGLGLYFALVLQDLQEAQSKQIGRRR